MIEKIFYSENRKGEYLDYLYYTDGQTEKKPLLIYIHGAGSRGTHLSFMSKAGPIGELEKGRYIPATVVCPQCHCDTWFELFDVLLEFIEHCINTENIDKNRVYLCGVSMGAYAAWQVAMSRPEWFAALVPVCGGGMYWNAGKLRKLPIMAFHGALDSVVLPEESIKMVRAVNQNGGNAKIIIYPDVEHDAWNSAFADNNMWDWMFSQERS